MGDGMTQAEKILSYMREHGSITARDAMLDLDIYRLAARVHDLRQDGYNVRSQEQRTVRGKHYAVYWLEE